MIVPSELFENAVWCKVVGAKSEFKKTGDRHSFAPHGILKGNDLERGGCECVLCCIQYL